MMNSLITKDKGLVKFDTAVKAVSEARTFYDALKIRNQAEALRTYGRISKDRTIEIDGYELRLRAHRQVGLLMKEAAEKGELNRGETGQVKGRDRSGRVKRTPPETIKPTLASQGIDKNDAKKARKLADMDDVTFDLKIKKMREKAIKTSDKILDKEFLGERRPVLDASLIADRFGDLLVKFFDQQKPKGFLKALWQYPDQISPEAQTRLKKKLQQVIADLQDLNKLLKGTNHDKETSNRKRLPHSSAKAD